MAVAIVEELEVIDVDQHQRERVPRAPRTEPFTLQHFVETSSIGDAGERVDGGTTPQLVGHTLDAKLAPDPHDHELLIDRLGDEIDCAHGKASNLEGLV